MKPARPLRLEAEEVWPRPSTPRDDARHVGERARAFAAVNDAVVDDGDLMSGAATFAQQTRAGTSLPRRCRCGDARADEGTPAGGAQAAVDELLHFIGDRPDHERSGRAGRRRPPIERRPAGREAMAAEAGPAGPFLCQPPRAAAPAPPAARVFPGPMRDTRPPPPPPPAPPPTRSFFAPT